MQWDPASKYLDWAKENGYENDSLEGQLNYLYFSMQPGNGEWLPNHDSVPSGYGMTYNDFITSNQDVDYLTQVFSYCYERPGEIHMDSRIERAEYWYDIFK